MAGGLLKNPVVMQIYADVTRMPLHLIGSDQGPALGSAMHAAVAAGAHPDIRAASEAMGSVRARRLRARRARAPTPTTRCTSTTRGCTTTSAAAATTSCTRCAAVRAAGGRRVADAIAALREQVCALHAELPRHGLVAWTSGNLSARVPGEELMVIKASGVAYDELTPDAMVVCDLDGDARRGRPRAVQRRRHARLHLPRSCAEVGGIAHTHSPYATAWADRAASRSRA